MTTVDIFARVSNQQQLDGQSDTTIACDNVLKLSESSSYLRDLGSGQPVAMRFYIDSANNTTLTSLTFNVLAASDEGMLSNVLTLASSGAVLAADIVAGAYFDVWIPAIPPTLGDGNLRRFVSGNVVIVGDVTITTFSAGLVVSGAGRVRKFVTGYTGP